MTKHMHKLTDWDIILAEAQDIIKRFPNLNLEAGLSLCMKPHLSKKTDILKVSFEDFTFNGDANSITDIPLLLELNLSDLSELKFSDYYRERDFTSFYDADSILPLNLTIHGESDYDSSDCYDDYDYEYNDDYNDDILLKREYGYDYYASGHYIHPNQIELVIPSEEISNLKLYNNSYIYMSFKVSASKIELIIDNENVAEFISSSKELLEFANKYLNQPLTLKEPKKTNTSADMLSNMYKSISTVIKQESIYAKKEKLVKELTELETWLRFDPSKRYGKPSAVFMILESLDFFPHIDDSQFENKNISFDGYLMSKSYWLSGKNSFLRKGEGSDNYRNGYLMSQFCRNEYSNYNISEFVSHYFEGFLGLDNISGATQHGSGMSMDINISKLLTIDVSDLLFLVKGKRYYVYTKDKGALIIINMEVEKVVDSELFKPSMVDFINDFQKNLKDVTPYMAK